jgi:hypothetical protein
VKNLPEGMIPDRDNIVYMANCRFVPHNMFVQSCCGNLCLAIEKVSRDEYNVIIATPESWLKTPILSLTYNPNELMYCDVDAYQERQWYFNGSITRKDHVIDKSRYKLFLKGRFYYLTKNDEVLSENTPFSFKNIYGIVNILNYKKMTQQNKEVEND